MPLIEPIVPLEERWWIEFSHRLMQCADQDADHPVLVDALPECLQQLGIIPQVKQAEALASDVDILIFGGAAYAGKTFSLLLEPLHHIKNTNFGATIFRRTYSRITIEGGMWDESQKLYRPLAVHPNRSELSYTFPSGASVNFGHLQHLGDEYAYYGAQICLLAFDQLEEFEASQFFYMVGRNRSTCGVKPYCRATCNPDPDSWLATFLAWWIDDQGDPIPERAGATRYFIRLPSDALAWADTADELYATYGPRVFPKSVAFIPGTMDDNPIGRERDPSYEANLMLQVGYLRQRLRYGNWKARATAGQFFKRHWFKIVDAAPADCTWVRCWDRAATEPSSSNPDPDWTAGVKLGRDPRGYFYVGDVRRDRVTPQGVEMMITSTASQDSYSCTVALLKDPAQAGKMEAEYLVRQLPGYMVRLVPQTKAKETAARPVASQAEAGNMLVVRGDWNEDFLSELDGFPDGHHDDQVDPLAGGMSVLCEVGPAEGLTPAEIREELAKSAPAAAVIRRGLMGGVRRGL